MEKIKTIKIGDEPISYWNYVLDDLLNKHDKIVIQVMDKDDTNCNDVFDSTFNNLFDKLRKKEYNMCEGCQEFMVDFISDFKNRFVVVPNDRPAKSIDYIPNRIKRINIILKNKYDLKIAKEIARTEEIRKGEKGDDISITQIIIEKEKIW